MPRLESSIDLKNPGDPAVQEFLESCGHDAAAHRDHVETMRYLLQNGAAFDERTIKRTRSPAAFQVLMDHGFTVHEDLNGAVPLIVSLPHTVAPLTDIRPNSRIVDILLERENSLPLHHAVVRSGPDRFEMMERPLRRGADANKMGYAHLVKYGGTPLHVAAYYGKPTDVQRLVDHGAVISIANNLKMRALGCAFLEEHEVWQCLFDLENKAEGTRVEEDSENPETG